MTATTTTDSKLVIPMVTREDYQYFASVAYRATPAHQKPKTLLDMQAQVVKNVASLYNCRARKQDNLFSLSSSKRAMTEIANAYIAVFSYLGYLSECVKENPTSAQETTVRLSYTYYLLSSGISHSSQVAYRDPLYTKIFKQIQFMTQQDFTPIYISAFVFGLHRICDRDDLWATIEAKL